MFLAKSIADYERRSPMLEQMFEKLFSIGEHFEIENGVCKQTDKTHDTHCPGVRLH